MRRQALVLLTASTKPIKARRETRNPAMQVGASSEGRAKEAPLVMDKRRHIAAKSRTIKSVVPSQGTDIVGVSPAPPAACQWAKGYLHQTSRVMATTARFNPNGGGSGWPPNKAVQVNTIGIAGRGFRFTPKGVTLAGGGLLPNARLM